MLQQPPEFFSNHCCAFVVCCYLPHLRNLVFIIFRYFYFKVAPPSCLWTNSQDFVTLKCHIWSLRSSKNNSFQKQFIPTINLSLSQFCHFYQTKKRKNIFDQFFATLKTCSKCWLDPLFSFFLSFLLQLYDYDEMMMWKVFEIFWKFN